MFRKIIIAAILFTGLLSCDKKSKSGFKYSEELVAIEKSLEPDIEATETKVERFATSGDYDSVVAAATRMEALVQKKIDEIEKKPLPKAKGVEDFKAAVMRYFGYIKGMYTTHRKWGAAGTEEEKQAELDAMQKLIEEKNDAVADMQAAQKKYADINGFKIEN